jgi:hypothetical protein
MALDFPANPTDGEVFDAYIWNAAKGVWQGIEESAAVTITSPVAPTTGTPGDLWFNSSTGILFTYYSDGSSAQWVEVVSSSFLDISGKADKSYVDSQDTTKANINSPTFTGTVSLPSDTSVGNISSTELGYVAGVTSSIQTQLNGKAASSHTHAASDVNSGTFAYDRMPAGTIIQTAFASTSNRVDVTAQDCVPITGLSINFTPRYANSLIMLEAMINSNEIYVSTFTFLRNAVSLTTATPNSNTSGGLATLFDGDSNSTNMRNTHLLWRDTAGSTAARTYAVGATSSWANILYTLVINDRTDNVMRSFSTFAIYEVKQ